MIIQEFKPGNAYSYKELIASPRKVNIEMNASVTNQSLNFYLSVETYDSMDSTCHMVVKFGKEIRWLEYPYTTCGRSNLLYWPLGSDLDLACVCGITKIRFCENRSVVDVPINASAEKVRDAVSKMRNLQKDMYNKLMHAQDF